MTKPEITLHVLPLSHPCKAVEEALAFKGLEFERVELVPGKQVPQLEEIYGEGATTVPGAVIDGTPIHGSRAIFSRLEELVPEPSLYPAPHTEAIREAERWGDQEFQDLGRYLTWGALHFRPDALGTLGGGDLLDPAGTDFAMKMIHGTWRYHGLSAQLLADSLAGLPAKLDHIDGLAEQELILAEAPNAADLQIGATARAVMIVGDLLPLFEGRAAEALAERWYPGYSGLVPAGALPPQWVPTAS